MNQNYSASSLSAPTPPSPKFKIIVATPTLPTLDTPHAAFLPNYLTAAGTITTTASDAAVYYTSSSQLYSDDSTFPIGAAIGSLAAKLTSYEGDDAVSTAWSLNAETSVVSWVSEEFEAWGGEKEGSFWLRMNQDGDVWAVFGGASTADAVPAQLLAVLDYYE